MDPINRILKRKKVNFSKLLPFGFKKNGNLYTYKSSLAGSGFLLIVTISADGRISSEIIDPSLNECYTLHLADGTAGSFVGKIRSQYEEILSEIAEKCFEWDVFKSKQAKDLIEYVRTTYCDELEFLWQKFPDNAVWRRKDNKKWYGALLTVSKEKLGLPSKETTEIIDLRLEPDKIASQIDRVRYFPGWHMNKKSWYTIILDGSVETAEICSRIHNSFLLAQKSK